jgi:adenylosuccinate synthase
MGGTVIDPKVLLEEIRSLESKGIVVEGRLHLSPYAHVIFPWHRLLDGLMEARKGKLAIGTTGRGIGPCYADKASRCGIRICELIDPVLLEKRLRPLLLLKNEELEAIYSQPPLDFESLYREYASYGRELAPFVDRPEITVALACKENKKVLFEGAHGALLDTTFGTYPYVTSSSTISSGVSGGAGIGASRITHTLGVVKAYTTRVGAGPLPTALRAEEQTLFLDNVAAREIGTTTGRHRRIGWFDACLVRHAARLNGMDSIALTKLDVLDALKEIKICTGYRLNGVLLDAPPPVIEDLERVEPVYEVMPGWMCATRNVTSYGELPKEARSYIERLCQLVEVPPSIVSLGPDREKTLFVQELFAR